MNRLRSMALAERSNAERSASHPAADAFRTLPMFCGLSERAMDRLLGTMSIEHIPAGFVLVREGVPQEWLYVLARGLLQVFTQRGPHVATLTILSAPALPCADAILGDSAPLVSVRTLQATDVGRIAIHQARQLFEKERAFADAITNDLAENWRNMLRESKNERTRNGFQRLVAWILAMLDHADDPHEIKLPYGKSTLAARLGVAPATLSRDLARLAPLGVVVRGRTLAIDDAMRLRELTVMDELNMPPVP
jgi:CRP/FNR family transcriptional activator FtrB